MIVWPSRLFLHKVFCEIVESQETKKRPPYRFPKKIESNKLKSNKKVGNLMVLLDEYANNKESYIVLLFSNNAAKYFYYIKDKLTSHIMLEAIDLIQEKITKESMDGVDDAEEVKENNTDMLQEFLHNLNLSDGDEITFVKESVGGEGEEDDNGDFYEVTNEEVIDLEPLSPKDNDQEIVDEEDEKNFKNF